jgi:hypothetical protein
MNFYFIFEGKTEPIVYRSWFSLLLPHLKEVDFYDEILENNYHYESDMGIPDCYNIVANAIQEINEFPKYDYLVLFIDADESEVEEKRAEALLHIQEKLNPISMKYKKLPPNCKLKIIVQKVCFETWFLGNRKFFVRNPQSEKLKKYINYFDVSKDNPENLASDFVQDENFSKDLFGYATKALFHFGYFREIHKERLKGLAYSKKSPKNIQSITYLEELIKRIESDDEHLLSFQELIDFCKKVSKQKEE